LLSCSVTCLLWQYLQQQVLLKHRLSVRKTAKTFGKL
jgi:hypothetical protein